MKFMKILLIAYLTASMFCYVTLIFNFYCIYINLWNMQSVYYKSLINVSPVQS